MFLFLVLTQGSCRDYVFFLFSWVDMLCFNVVLGEVVMFWGGFDNLCWLVVCVSVVGLLGLKGGFCVFGAGFKGLFGLLPLATMGCVS